jgi:transposase-like protein
VHKPANLLDKLPKNQQPKAKGMLHAIWQAATRPEAEKAFDLFVATDEVKYPQATNRLSNDGTELLVFYDFPSEQWLALRTTNAIESTFATVRLRTEKSKRTGTRGTCLTIVFKLMEGATKHWRLLNGSKLP